MNKVIYIRVKANLKALITFIFKNIVMVSSVSA